MGNPIKEAQKFLKLRGFFKTKNYLLEAYRQVKILWN